MILKIVECSFSDYLTYLLEKINIYVFSLTKNEDALSMWKYYGNGGISIEIDCEELVKEIIEKLNIDDDCYVVNEDVIYDEQDLNKKFTEFNIYNHSSGNISVLKADCEKQA